MALVWVGGNYYLIKRPQINCVLFRSPLENGGKVQVSQILIEIDNEIARLQQARNLLAGTNLRGSRRGSYGGAANAAKSPGRRRLSPEGRRKIAEAMKRRWAERRKEQAAKAAKAVKA